VIGTTLLSHFRATLDYAGGALVLERQTSHAATTTPAAQIPFWLVGDHFILAEGRLNDAPPALFFVDTGLAGFAFTGPESELKAGGIEPPAVQPDTDGGIGTAPHAIFEIKRLSLGRVERKDLQGLYGPFPPSLETALGVRVAGIISHGFFRPYAVTFDFQRMTIEVRR
jgi:hypothetical protein